MRETVYLLSSTRFNGDFNVCDDLGVFATCELAKEYRDSLKTLGCNHFTKYDIKPIPLYKD